jgi:hypothetical protein
MHSTTSSGRRVAHDLTAASLRESSVLRFTDLLRCLSLVIGS